MFLRKRWNYPRWRCGHKWNLSRIALGMKNLFVGHRFLKHGKTRGSDCSLRSKAMACWFPHHCGLLKRSVRLIRAENKRTQLCLQLELAEEKSQQLHAQKSPQWAQQMYVRKEKNRCIECYNKVLYAGLKHFDKLKPEPGPTRKARPDLQPCSSPLIKMTSALNYNRFMI